MPPCMVCLTRYFNWEILQVLKERIMGPDSPFHSYIDNLPMGVPGIPMFFSPDAIRALEQYPPLRCHPAPHLI